MKVSIEDERKFRVIEGPVGTLTNGAEITQGYLCIVPPIRVRVVNFDECVVFIKIKDGPGRNFEFSDDNLSLKDAMKLMGAHKYHKIRKTRYKIGRLEVDVFLGELEGLVLIEFEQNFSGEHFEIPADFSVEEVTGDTRFENHHLCQLDKLPEEWRGRHV